jgi:hypothetical protein
MLKATAPHLKATVSGSFHRHMAAIYESVGQLRSRGVTVLSPSDPRVVDNIGEFLFVASDKLRSIRLVQDRHLQAIQASDFLWVVCPEGYTGPSTCLEIGTALAANVPVLSSTVALDITVGEYVRRVSGYDEAISYVSQLRRIERPANVLLDPEQIIDESMDALSNLRPALTGIVGDRRGDAERQYDSTRRKLAKNFRLHSF